MAKNVCITGAMLDYKIYHSLIMKHTKVRQFFRQIPIKKISYDHIQCQNTNYFLWMTLLI